MRLSLVAAVAVLVAACASARVTSSDPSSAPTGTSVVFAHINDVYEIDAIENGEFGGLARVATIFDRLRADRTPVLTTLGGDYLSPSALGTARISGELVAGRQMVEVLNAIGLQWAVVGNHEFDLTEPAFRSRLAESTFTTIAGNATDAAGQPFPNTVASAVATVRANGRDVRIGLIGVVTDFNRKPWVRYLSPVDVARAQVAAFRGNVDAVVALTHLPLSGDQALVEAVPEIDLVLGGHEHENVYIRRGSSFAPIVKADANARSVAIVTMALATGSRPEVAVRFELVDRRIPPQPRTQALVKQWMDAGIEAFQKDGLDALAVVATVPSALDGREQTVRRRSGDLTNLIADALRRETGADIGIVNGGSIRIDDVIQAGPVRQYDIIRVVPFGGTVVKATLEGAVLARMLDAGVQNLGIGGFLHLVGADGQPGAWQVAGRPLDPAGTYTIAVPEFLMTGGESRLEFLNRQNPQITGVKDFRDIRLVIIDELRRRFGR